MKWSEEVRHQSRPIVEKIMESGFVRDLAAGTLPESKFRHYLEQDALYLVKYSRVLAHVASRLPKADMRRTYLGFATESMAVEQAMHEVFLSKFTERSRIQTPSALLYTSILESQAMAPVEVEAAATLPCFWIYEEVGNHIAVSSAPGNPYAEWIATYSSPGFEASTCRAIGICDTLADMASPTVRREMTDAYLLCARMEYMFWQSAYELEQWKI